MPRFFWLLAFTRRQNTVFRVRLRARLSAVDVEDRFLLFNPRAPRGARSMVGHAHPYRFTARRTARQLAQGGMKDHVGAPPSLAVVKQATLDLKAEHFLRTKRLCAELHFISRMSLRFAPFVFNRNNREAGKRGAFQSGRGARAPRMQMKLHHIALSAQAEFEGANWHPPRDANPGTGFIRPFVRALMQQIAFTGRKIIRPDLLDMDERALPFAEKKMLKRRDREERVFGEHGGNFSRVRTF